MYYVINMDRKYVERKCDDRFLCGHIFSLANVLT